MKLKLCPFCGGKALLQYHPSAEILAYLYSVECQNCFSTSFQYFKTEDEAIWRWNNRHINPENLYNIIIDCLKNYNVQYNLIDDDSGDHLPLVDALVPAGLDDIEFGLEEIDLLADELADTIYKKIY